MTAARAWLLVGGLFAVLAAVAVVWSEQDRRPPAWDHANHLERAVRCGRILAEEGAGGLPEVALVSSFYPPVVTCAAGLLLLLFPAHPLAAPAVMVAFLGLALASIHLLGRRLVDAPAGALAALVFGSAPFVVFSTVTFQLDLPLAAAVALSLVVLLRTEALSRRGWCVALGLTLAFGMLVKPPFAVYVLPPLAIELGRGLRGRQVGRALGNLALAVALGGLLSLPWYGPRIFGLPLQILNRAFKQAAESGYPETLTRASLLFYPRTLAYTFGLLAALLFAWGLVALVRRESGRGLLWGASLVPFAVFWLIQNKNLRYVLPIFPAAAVIAAVGLRALPPAWRRGVTVVLVLLSALQVGHAAFGVPPVPAWRLFGLPLIFSYPSSPETWPHREILDVIVRESGGAPATVSVVPNYDRFSVSNFRLYAVERRLPLTFTRAWDVWPLGVDFVILKTGELGPDFSTAKARRIMGRLAAGDPAFERAFPVVWQARLPDGSVGTVRQRRLTPVEDSAPEALAAALRQAIPRFLRPYARDMEGLAVDLAYAPEALLRGRVQQVRLSARSARVAEFARRGAVLRLGDIRLGLDGVVFNPYRLIASGELELLGLRRFRVEHLVATEEDLRAFLTGLRRLRGLRVRLDEGVVAVELVQPGPDLAARLALERGGDGTPLRVHALRLSVGGFPLPAPLVRWVFRHFDPAPRLQELPVSVALGRIRVEPGRLVISGEPEGGGR